MPKKHTYKTVGPDGTVITRTTHRTYTHAVWARCRDQKTNEWHWGVVGFCGRPDLADKAAVQYAKVPEHYLEVHVREATL